MKISNETGLPELPKGHYWHVRKDLEGDYLVQIRRGWVFPFSVLVQQVWTYDYLTPEKLSSMAEQVYSRFELRHTAETLLGSYPPRTVGKDV